MNVSVAAVVAKIRSDPRVDGAIAWAFERYAAGETSVTALLRDLTARGLVSVPSPNWIHCASPTNSSGVA